MPLEQPLAKVQNDSRKSIPFQRTKASIQMLHNSFTQQPSLTWQDSTNSGIQGIQDDKYIPQFHGGNFLSASQQKVVAVTGYVQSTGFKLQTANKFTKIAMMQTKCLLYPSIHEL